MKSFVGIWDAYSIGVLLGCRQRPYPPRPVSISRPLEFDEVTHRFSVQSRGSHLQPDTDGWAAFPEWYWVISPH